MVAQDAHAQKSRIFFQMQVKFFVLNLVLLVQSFGNLALNYKIILENQNVEYKYSIQPYSQSDLNILHHNLTSILSKVNKIEPTNC